jgi:hypothetical protein
VPSLEPRQTEQLWRSLVQRGRAPRAATATAECRPLRAVFYAATDWLRLATTLAAKASPCAQYYISVPPLTSDKTVFRPGQAARIRALGPSFHAAAEVHLGSWRAWVAANGGSWFQAGVEARKRMAAAGYDVALGDTWAINELSSAVRLGTGTARADARELARGLFSGDGTLPTAKGAVFVIGIGQNVPDVTVYQARMEDWLQDAAFWSDMSAYVSDWSSEAYGDFRHYGVPGAALADRRGYLNDYLQHQLILARVAPEPAAAARTFLESAASPLANAAWQWSSSFGWTMVSSEQMQGYVSAQVYALRSFAAGAGDHWGFAWAPRNGAGLPAGDFTRQSGALLDRLATAIRDSGESADPGDPGGGACGPPAQNLFCVGDVDGARFNPAWRSFSAWALPSLVFTSAPQTLTAGLPSAPVTLQLQQGGVPRLAAGDLTVTVASSSPQGTLAAGPEGPWTSTLTLVVPSGTSSPPAFFYQDTRAGAPVLTASGTGASTGSQALTVVPGPAAGLRLAPGALTAAAGTSVELTATALDAFGNATPATTATWSVDPASLGTIVPAAGSSVLFAATTPGRGTVTARVVAAAGSLSASATVTVTAPPMLRVLSIRYRAAQRRLRVTTQIVDHRGRPVRRGAVSFTLLRNGSRYRTVTASTGAAGRATFSAAAPAGCYTTRITQLQAPGLRWSGRTPTNRFCTSTRAKR